MYISRAHGKSVPFDSGKANAIKARSVETVDSFSIIEHIQMIPSGPSYVYKSYSRDR